MATKQLSRQRLWQLKQTKAGRCSQCGKHRKKSDDLFCKQCRLKKREYYRELYHVKNPGARYYKEQK